jgi:hypothetical protein
MIEDEDGATLPEESASERIRRRTFLKGGALAGATLMAGGVLAAVLTVAAAPRATTSSAACIR